MTRTRDGKTRLLAILAVLATVFLFLFGGVTRSFAASDTAGQCAGYLDAGNVKVDTSDGSIILDVGLTVCIHASNGNTGSFVTDGTSTLADYILASGLLNEGGQVPNVSNYVTYGGAQPSTEPTSTPTPSAEPTTTPSVEPSSDPTPSPTSSETPSQTSPVTPRTNATPPPTDTTAETRTASSDATNFWLAVGIVALATALSVYRVLRAPRPRRSYHRYSNIQD